MMMVIEGHKTWREACSDTAEFILRSIGISAEEAIQIATVELPLLPSFDAPSRAKPAAKKPLKPAVKMKAPQNVKNMPRKKQ